MAMLDEDDRKRFWPRSFAYEPADDPPPSFINEPVRRELRLGGSSAKSMSTHLNGDPADVDQPSEFKLLVEERRIVESIAGNENLEIQ